jgi:hypothetical protein
MASSSSHGSSSMGDSFSIAKSNSVNSSSSNDDGMIKEMFADMNIHKQHAFVTTIVDANSSNMFNANELEEGVIHSVDSCVVVWDVLVTMQATTRLFKTLTNFILVKFDELALLVAPTTMCHAQSTGEHHIQVLDLGFALKF